MPIASIRGVNLNYEVLGAHGPWLALSPGGRRALDLVKPLAQRMCDAGYRVLLHDRRNCGISDIAIGGHAHRMIPHSELFDLFPGDLDVDLVPPEDWAHKEVEIALVFADFLRRRVQLKAA